MAQGLATQTPISRGATLFTGGTTHHHPFKFADASTTGPVVVKTKITAKSELVKVVYPQELQTILGLSAAGSYTDAITITAACKIWLKGTVASGACTAAELTKTDPAGGALLIFDAATPFAQNAFYVLLAEVTAGAASSESGYDLTISGDPFHLRQVAFNHLRLEQRVASGKVVLLPCPV
jgi:hypothetical protein